MNRQTTALVTGVGGQSVGHQILHSLRLLGEKYRIIATDATRFSYGLYEAHGRYIVPLASSPNYIPAILRIVQREKIEVILPGSQPEVMALASNQAVFDSICHLIISPAPVVELCQSKKLLYTWLLDNGYEVPKTCAASEWKALVRDCGFPIIGKPTEDTGGSKNVAILKDEMEVEHYFMEMPHEKIILQEYVGSPYEEYTVGVLVSREGQIIDSIVLHRKLIGLSLGVQRKIGEQRYALSTGYSQGFVIRHPAIQLACESLATQMGIRGPVNIQLRMVGGKAVIFEVHPRFSGSTSIRADVGFNEPDVLIRNYLRGDCSGRLPYQSDVAAIRAFQTTIVPVEDLNSVLPA